MAEEKGIFIPQLQLKEMKNDLSKIFEMTKAEKLIINGDFKHEFGEASRQEWREVKDFVEFAKRKFEEIILVRGNHDNYLLTIASHIGLKVYDPFYFEKGILFTHGHKKIEYPENVEVVLKKIQRCDPLGISASNVQEALLVQIEFLSTSTQIPEFAEQAISEEFELLAKRHYNEIAKHLGTTSQKIKLVSNFISDNLNPFPARAHWGNVRQPNDSAPEVFHQPDILINYLNNKPGNPLVVEIITPSRGTLRLNPLFKKAIKEQTGEKREAWKRDLNGKRRTMSLTTSGKRRKKRKRTTRFNFAFPLIFAESFFLYRIFF